MKTVFRLIEEHGLTLHGDIEHFAEIIRADERKQVALDKKAENARELGLDYEPDEWMTGCPECGIDSGCDCDSGTWNPPAQPAPVQEPVAKHYMDGGHLVYPTAQRQWVGLTDEEIEDIVEEFDGVGWDVAQAIKAKLKEKNNG
jgi:hypothetical protein